MPEHGRIPLTLEELDAADATLTKRPTLAEQLGWSKEDYAAVDAAIDEQRWEQPKDSDPQTKRLLDRISGTNDSSAQHAGKEKPAATAPSDRDSVMAHRKMSDPEKYPRMTAGEVMSALLIKKSAVYQHPGLERVSTGTRAVRFTTKSVLAVKNSPPE